MLPSKMFFDNFFDDFEPQKKFEKMMKCDIYEKNGNYILEMDVPGFKKNDINMEIENGYLKVSVEKHDDSEEKENKKYVHRERHTYEKCERMFYIGDVSEDLVKAKFKNGILKITVPKEDKKEQSKKVIQIED